TGPRGGGQPPGGRPAGPAGGAGPRVRRGEVLGQGRAARHAPPQRGVPAGAAAGGVPAGAGDVGGGADADPPGGAAVRGADAVGGGRGGGVRGGDGRAGEAAAAMSGWDWFCEYEWDALRDGDAERLRLAQLHHRAYEHRETDPDRALALLAEGRSLAVRLREP